VGPDYELGQKDRKSNAHQPDGMPWTSWADARKRVTLGRKRKEQKEKQKGGGEKKTGMLPFSKGNRRGLRDIESRPIITAHLLQSLGLLNLAKKTTKEVNGCKGQGKVERPSVLRDYRAGRAKKTGTEEGEVVHKRVRLAMKRCSARESKNTSEELAQKKMRRSHILNENHIVFTSTIQAERIWAVPSRGR